VIRGTDWLGNGGFVRNLVEKARDHRSDRLVDTPELDELLDADRVDLSPVQLRWMRELTREDFGEGMALAVADAERHHRDEP
jgi:hypothetical protein